MSEYTKGPWMPVIGHKTGAVRGITASTRNVINFRGISTPCSKEGQANARLIAAAPDMREKIEDALKGWDIMPRDRPFNLAEVTDWLTRYMAPAMDGLRAAIAEAEGKF